MLSFFRIRGLLSCLARLFSTHFLNTVVRCVCAQGYQAWRYTTRVMFNQNVAFEEHDWLPFLLLRQWTFRTFLCITVTFWSFGPDRDLFVHLNNGSCDAGESKKSAIWVANYTRYSSGTCETCRSARGVQSTYFQRYICHFSNTCTCRHEGSGQSSTIVSARTLASISV